MSFDQAIKWALIGIIALIDLVLLKFCNLTPQYSDLIVPAIGGMLLVGLSIYYHQRGGDSLVLCMVTLLHIGCYTTVISLFMYEATSFGFPLNDGWLRAFDDWIGYSPSRLVNWTKSQPLLDYWLTWVYLFIVPETLLTVLAVAFSNKRRLLEQFTCQFMLGTAVCAIFTCFLPANGPLHNHGITPTEWQQPFLDHFRELRTGDPFLFSWKGTEGLVTFPSFHTAWAIFLIFVWREQTRWLTVPLAILNLLIIFSTLTTGEHYVFDVIAGFLVAWFCIAVSKRLTTFSYHVDGSPKRIPIPSSQELWPVLIRRMNSR